MTTSYLWQRACAVNARAHEHQYRKDGVTPYAAHPARVALTCALLFGCTDENVIAAALLHDVIEDTGMNYEDVADEFGNGIADIVAALSKDDRLAEPEREPAYDRRLADGPWQARLIKLADVYDNLTECADDAARGRQLAKVERALKLAEGDDNLRRASAIVRDFAERIQATIHRG